MDFNNDDRSILNLSIITTFDGSLSINGTQGVVVPSGTTAQRVATNGVIRFNTSTGLVEVYSGAQWVDIVPSGGGGGAVTSVFGRTGIISATEGDYTLTQLGDVSITSPINAQTLSYNGASWVNSNVAATSYSVIINSWTLDTGSYYYADVTHNLGTQNIVVALHDTTLNEFVYPDKVSLSSANVIRVRVFGNTRTVRCVVLANGTTIAAGGSTPSSIIVQDDAVNVTNTPHTILNFGSGLVVTNSGGGSATIAIQNNILRSVSWYSTSLDNPNSTDWVINALAPGVADPVNTGLSVRQFNDTTEQGIGGVFTIPINATTIIIKTKGRAQTAPVATAIVQPRIYFRSIPDNSAISAWTSANNLANISIPTNLFYQYNTQTFSLSSLGLSAGVMYQFEMTRRTSGLTGGTSLVGNWLMSEIIIEFT